MKPQSPLELILHFLGVRPRSIAEVRSRLARYGVEDPAPIIQQLLDAGLLNDTDFARWLVTSRLKQLHSPRRIRLELKHFGLSPDQIDVALHGSPDPKITIRRILSKKFGNSAPLDDLARQKIISYLLRQGFAWEVVREVVKSWESE